MSDFQVRVKRIEDVSDHPNADRLSIVKIGGYELISNKVEGRARYQAGDYVCYIPEDSLLPEWLLKRLDMWDEPNNKGHLSGPDGNRVKAIKLRGVVSQGVMLPVDVQPIKGKEHGRLEDGLVVSSPERRPLVVREGDDVAEYLGIRKYVPPIPMGMEGTIYPLRATAKYDVESIQNYPDTFVDGEQVSVTEKLHGTNFQAGLIPDVPMGDGFGDDGTIYVTSKGYGAQGLALSNARENDYNVYVRTLRALLDDGLEAKLLALSAMFGGQPVRLFGEIVGKGIQDLHYGFDKPQARFFDISVGDMFLPPTAMQQAAAALNLATVPVLYEGPFDRDALIQHRDGKDSVSGTHVREGIVIRACDPTDGTRMRKWVSPNYLLRKGGTEYN